MPVVFVTSPPMTTSERALAARSLTSALALATGVVAREGPDLLPGAGFRGRGSLGERPPGGEPCFRRTGRPATRGGRADSWSGSDRGHDVQSRPHRASR